MISLSDLPSLNALLNTTSAILLILGRRFIKKGNMIAHRNTMISVVAVSTLFLASYITYHTFHGSRPFQGEGWIRPIYFSILISHTILATAIVPLVLITLYRGLRKKFAAHARLAKWTYPLWLYVSFTGVLIYIMLYHLFA